MSAWFRGAARALPWRTTPRDPYRSLVSEFMLQQTQAGRVAERFGPFLARFPTVAALAAADEQDVLAAWSGMGYYRRALNLHGAARAIVERFGGRVPAGLDDLASLPGVGRYTAGAIASMVFGRAAPIVDANVARVLARVEARAKGATDAWLWERAGAMVSRAGDPGAFNEGMMELGATLCGRRPRCDRCPLADLCIARRRGLQGRIPGTRARTARTALWCAAAVVTGPRGTVLVERRGQRGLWAGMWQVPTDEGNSSRGAARALGAALGLELTRVERFTHNTTHRQVTFDVWRSRPLSARASAVLAARRPGARWVARRRVAELALSSPQRRILLGTDR